MRDFIQILLIVSKVIQRDLNKSIKKIHLQSKRLKKILNDIDTSTITGKRDKAIILLMVIGGLRSKEVVNIDIQDIEKKIINTEYALKVKDIKPKIHISRLLTMYMMLLKIIQQQDPIQMVQSHYLQVHQIEQKTKDYAKRHYHKY